jgi:4'-phosphopantetheinyl transferase
MDAPLTRQSPRRLDVGQVDVWLTLLSDIDDGLQRAYQRLLSDAEHARWQRFRVPSPQLQYLVARALLRTRLSQYADASEHSWQFDANKQGRPFISQPSRFRDLHFSLSHTDGLVACAIAKDCDIGIDVENIRHAVNVDALAPSVLSAPELASLTQSPPDERGERFLSYWTLKEAYIKARGLGLSLPLDGFSFDLDAPSPRISFTERCPDDPARWRFRQYRPTREHKLAVAVSTRAGELDIRLRWVVPLMSDADVE